jgi:hypothetical protein
MKKTLGLLSVTIGAISSVLGVIGATLLCGVVCCGGPVLLFLGAGTVVALHKYSPFFIWGGILLLIVGITLLVWKKKSKDKNICLCKESIPKGVENHEER